MSHQQELLTWSAELSRHFGHLNQWQIHWLAVYSFGMTVIQSSGLTSLSAFWAGVWGKKENTVRQYLREGLYAKKDKQGGPTRQEIVVHSCFAGLLGWILGWWSSDEKRLALALDATSLRDQWTVLVVSVVYRGCAIPVAWVVLEGQQKGTWRPYWEALLKGLMPAVPSDWQVIVLADRGLYAKWLFQAIIRQGWHPFLRINIGGLARAEAETTYRALSSFVLADGKVGQERVRCFKSDPVWATLLTVHDPTRHEHPWLILTDLPPQTAQIAWYGMRMWIERGFKHIKRAGWHWEQTKITEPDRVERLWLVMSVATLWVLALGSAAEDALPPSSLDALPLTHIARTKPRRTSRPRLLGCFKRGICTLLVALVTGKPLPLPFFAPEPWLREATP
jgi:hypothetical protein